MNLMTDLIKINYDSGFENPKKVYETTHTYLVLSLFFLLLAFFILLNAISRPAEVKSQAVIASLISTFRSIENGARVPDTLPPRLSVFSEPEDLINEMRRRLVSEVPIAELKVFNDSRRVWLRLPADRFFLDGKARIRNDRLGMVADMASVLTTEVSGYRNEFEVLVGSNWSVGSNLDFDASKLEILRAVAFAEKLISVGAPRHTISIGIHEGDVRELELRFIVRSKASERAEF